MGWASSEQVILPKSVLRAPGVPPALAAYLVLPALLRMSAMAPAVLQRFVRDVGAQAPDPPNRNLHPQAAPLCSLK